MIKDALENKKQCTADMDPRSTGSIRATQTGFMYRFDVSESPEQ